MVDVPMRVHFTYSTVDKPWGGANNFIRTLKERLVATGDVELTDSLEEPCDLLFMNQLAPGPGASGRKLSLSAVDAARRRDGCRLVVRAVNLYRHAFRRGPCNLVKGTLSDRSTIKLLEMADTAIFQSDYQRNVFRGAGYVGKRHAVIHNGADPVYWNDAPPARLGSGPLRVVSATNSDRASKRHDLIAAISRLPGVEATHCGAWPKGLDPGNVNLLGSRERGELARLYAGMHFFVHPAVKDPCPNAVVEAICSGLPVLYNPGPGSSREIVSNNGMALDINDLAASLSTARNCLEELQQAVRSSRARYRIERATEDYLEVFRAEMKRCEEADNDYGA